MRLFIDHCVPKSVIEYLTDKNYGVFILRDYLPTDSSDVEVISKAKELDAVLLSLNSDFTNIVKFPPSKYNGIISIQLKNHPEIIPELLKKLDSFLTSHPGQDFYEGRLFIVEVHRIRIWK